MLVRMWAVSVLCQLTVVDFNRGCVFAPYPLHDDRVRPQFDPPNPSSSSSSSRLIGLIGFTGLLGLRLTVAG